MSSVEISQREQDSLSEQQQQVLKTKKIQRNRHQHSKNSKNIDSAQVLYSQTLTQYMFGKFQIASQNCKKMIANNSQNPQPYFLMATMYQQAAARKNDQNQLYKSVEYFFFHAFYSTPSVQKWLKVADMSFQLSLYQQAAYCYGRALKMNKTNLQISLKRAQCLQMCLQIKKAANIYKRIIQKISNSVQVHKRYAKLRFKRQQYSKARQILLSYPNYQSDINIKFMIAQTMLKEKQFIKLYQFIKKYIIEHGQGQINNIYEDLQIQFIQMLFICRINCMEQTEGIMAIDVGQTLQYLIKQYCQQQHILYQQILTYIKKQNPQISYRLLQHLLKYQQHQTIQNYLYCSQYLIKINKNKQAINILQHGLNTDKNRTSVQLKTQINYLKTFNKNNSNKGNNKINKINKEQEQIGRKKRDITKKKGKDQVISKFINNKDKKEQQIYYSDQQQPVNNDKQQKYQEYSQDMMSKQQRQYSYKKSEQQSDQSYQFSQQNDRKKNNIKTKKITKKNNTKPTKFHMQVKDPDIVSKLITNNQLTLTALKDQIQTTKNNKQNNFPKQVVINRTFSQVKQCLQYLVEIQSTREPSQEQLLQNSKNRHSIFNNRQPKKRRMIIGGQTRRNNLITKNSKNLIQSIKIVIYFMKQYIKVKRFHQVIDFAQMLSKAHFFKWQNRILQFKILKRQVYEMGVLACLQLKKYGKSIFFLRYLINKNPLNQFYLAIAQKIMRLSTGKLFINKMIKKGISIQISNIQANNNKSQKQLIKIYYMTGLQYMQNCFFDLAINMFTKVLYILQPQQYQQSNASLIIYANQIYKTIYLSMATCFLQIASSRTVYNKLDYVNRSAYCLARYKAYYPLQNNNIQMMYNQARWYSYVKLFYKAIPIYQNILELGINQQLCMRSIVNLMVIYRDLQQYGKLQQLAQKYFNPITINTTDHNLNQQS